MLLVRGGVTDPQILSLVLANVRTPEERQGDLMAQVMSNRRGADRLLETVARFGLPRVRRNMSALQDYSERMMRASSAVCRTVSTPSGLLDNDGVSPNPWRFA